MPTELSRALRTHREAAGLSQSQAGEAIGVSQQAISAWERGRDIPDGDNLAAAARAYHVPLESLLELCTGISPDVDPLSEAWLHYDLVSRRMAELAHQREEARYMLNVMSIAHVCDRLNDAGIRTVEIAREPMKHEGNVQNGGVDVLAICPDDGARQTLQVIPNTPLQMGAPSPSPAWLFIFGARNSDWVAHVFRDMGRVRCLLVPASAGAGGYGEAYGAVGGSGMLQVRLRKVRGRYVYAGHDVTDLVDLYYLPDLRAAWGLRSQKPPE